MESIGFLNFLNILVAEEMNGSLVSCSGAFLAALNGERCSEFDK